MKSTRSLPASLVLAALATSSVALAAPAPPRAAEPPVDDATLKARELVERGTEEYGRQHWEAARDAYAAAWDLKHHFAIAANLAEVEMQLGRYLEAADHWKFALAHLPPGDAERRAHAETRRTECGTHLAIVRISVNVVESEVRLDGAALGHSPLAEELWLAPGKHVLRAERPGYRAAAHELVASEGETREVSIALEPAAPPPVPSREPSVRHDAPAPARVAPSGNTARTVVLVGGGVLAVAGIGVGVGYALDARAAADTASAIRAELASDSACAPPPGTAAPAGCAELARKNAQSKQSDDVAAAGFVAGGLLGAATIAAVFLWPGDATKDRARVSVAPWATAGSQGVRVVGSF